MDAAEVLGDLRDYVQREVLSGRDLELDGSTPLLEWGIIDSLSLLRMIVHIQDRFGVEVPPERLVPEYFNDLDTITEMVVELVGQASPNGRSEAASVPA